MPSQGYQYASGRIAALDSRLPSEQEVRNASSGGLDNLVRLFPKLNSWRLQHGRILSIL